MVNSPHNHDVPARTSDYWECPKCHQHTLVHHGESVYVCLNCDFYKDISQSKGSKKEAESGAGAFNVFIAILIAAALAALIL